MDSVISVEPVYEAPQFRFAVYFEHKKEKKAWYFKADTEVAISYYQECMNSCYSNIMHAIDYMYNYFQFAGRP